MNLRVIQRSVYLRQLFDPETSTYTYLLVDPESLEAVLIDPVKERLQRDLRVIRELEVTLKYVLDTHVHADHITSSDLLRQELGVKTGVAASSHVDCADLKLENGDKILFGGSEISVIATYGHTDTCMSFYCDGMLFTGDTLFIRGTGRTDFQQGSPEQLYESITQKLFSYPDETLVYPGHDYKGETVSSIGEEKRFNPRVHLGKSKEDFVKIMNSLKLPLPKKIKESVPDNLQCGRRSIDEIHEATLSMRQLHDKISDLPAEELFLDVRTPEEYASAHIENSRNIPHDRILERVEELKKFKLVYIYCKAGGRAQMAFNRLFQAGLNNLICVSSGGMDDWVNAQYPVVSS